MQILHDTVAYSVLELETHFDQIDPIFGFDLLVAVFNSSYIAHIIEFSSFVVILFNE
jgi:hypothetical protein